MEVLRNLHRRGCTLRGVAARIGGLRAGAALRALSGRSVPKLWLRGTRAVCLECSLAIASPAGATAMPKLQLPVAAAVGVRARP
jgi:hypothetical protein